MMPMMMTMVLMMPMMIAMVLMMLMMMTVVMIVVVLMMSVVLVTRRVMLARRRWTARDKPLFTFQVQSRLNICTLGSMFKHFYY